MTIKTKKYNHPHRYLDFLDLNTFLKNNPRFLNNIEKHPFVQYKCENPEVKRLPKDLEEKREKCLEKLLKRFNKKPTTRTYNQLMLCLYNPLHPPRYYYGLEIKDKIKRYAEFQDRKNMTDEDYRSFELKETDKKVPDHFKGKSENTKWVINKGAPRNSKGLAQWLIEQKPEYLSKNDLENLIEALENANRRGRGAWKSGSRPGQTPDSWGKARMYKLAKNIYYQYKPSGRGHDVDLLNLFF